MSNTYSVVIRQLATVPSLNNLSNVVTRVLWSAVGTDGTYTATFDGDEIIGPPNPSNFTPYTQLTSDKVAEWVPNVLSEGVKLALDSQIAMLKARSESVVQSPPWVPAPPIPPAPAPAPAP